MGTAGFLFQTVPYLGEIISSSINPVSVPGSGDWVNPISWRALTGVDVLDRVPCHAQQVGCVF